jgi:probable phosphoglycerate mutase
MQVQTTPDLRERHLGVLQGLAYAEAPAAQPAAWACLCSDDDGVSIPGGGESVVELSARIKAAIDRLAQQHPGESNCS